ncbi:hypothetical protein EVAR_100445_1 [Eumeta japonica]|uniref:Uncharacterized protein n=1 Tax=Eumeta variegata TaxID=151549 RepID=A0A4C2A0E2_EUMVA|nr:hypothetical protein EVAR_100445_1 [Eumeta japonica]
MKVVEGFALALLYLILVQVTQSFGFFGGPGGYGGGPGWGGPGFGGPGFGGGGFGGGGYGFGWGVPPPPPLPYYYGR